jgi:hypothetical protein
MLTGILGGIFSVTFFAVVAVVLAAVALAYALKRKSGGSGKKGTTLIPFSSGLVAGGSTFGTGANAIAFGFGSVSNGAGVLSIGEVVGAASFVAPCNGHLKNLFVQFSASGATGADAVVGIYTTPSCGPRTCGVDLVPTRLAVAGVLASTSSTFCLRNTCRSVKVRCGDRIALVASTGTLITDLAVLTSLSASVQFVCDC